MIKRDWGGKQEINTETYLKKKKIKRENMEKKDTTMSEEKKTTGISKKLLSGKKVSI